MRQYIAMDVDALGIDDASCKAVSAMEPQEMVDRTVKAGKELLLQVLHEIVIISKFWAFSLLAGSDYLGLYYFSIHASIIFSHV